MVSCFHALRLTSAGSSFSWISTWLSVSGLKLSISDEIFSRAISKSLDRKASGMFCTFSFGQKHFFYCFHFLELAFVKVVDVGRNVFSTDILRNIFFLIIREFLPSALGSTFFSTTSWCFSSFFSKFSTSLRSSLESRMSA